jgi:hypothetical protein
VERRRPLRFNREEFSVPGSQFSVKTNPMSTEN